jgi:putative hydrolase of the HAD superfamily
MMDAQYLLIDADDTLWENNVYFERVIQEVQALLKSTGAETENFREELDETERRRIPLTGYGTVNFTESLVETFENFLPAHSDPALVERVRQLSLGILHHPLEIFPGVPETLAYLSRRHALFLVTKGEPVEQARKVRDSSFHDFFRSVEIVPEKNAGTYSEIMTRHGMNGSRSWMIGNSPRSDINPALAAGMTWIFEHEEPAQHPGLLELERFSDLRLHF